MKYFCLLFLTSCSVNPFILETQQSKLASLGGSFMTKNVSENSSITRPDGTILTHNSVGKDETVVPSKYIATQGNTHLLNATANKFATIKTN